MRKPILIGIAGGSGSGKTTVQRKIVESFNADQVVVLEHDSYYVDLAHLSFEERAAFNVDHPDSLESSLLVEHLDALLDGQSIESPVYDFTQHIRTDETVSVRSRPIIILEGILILFEEELRSRMDIKIFVDTSDDLRLLRRIKRDMECRGRDLDSILDQYEKTVRPMHLQYVEPSKRHADVIIPHGGENNVAVNMVKSRISDLLTQ